MKAIFWNQNYIKEIKYSDIRNHTKPKYLHYTVEIVTVIEIYVLGFVADLSEFIICLELKIYQNMYTSHLYGSTTSCNGHLRFARKMVNFDPPTKATPKESYMGFWMVYFFWPQLTFRGQRSRSNPKKFEIKYLKNGKR